MIKKLTDEQMRRYVKAQDAKLDKMHVTVDELHRKNLQAWIPYDLWNSVRERVAAEGTSMNKYIEQALATYLLLEDGDIERILARHAE